MADQRPDRYCVTRADGECVSADPRCMHWLKPPLIHHRYNVQKLMPDGQFHFVGPSYYALGNAVAERERWVSAHPEHTYRIATQAISDWYAIDEPVTDVGAL